MRRGKRVLVSIQVINLIEDIDPAKFENSLNGKTVIMAVTASISIYRVPDIVRDLRREGATVVVAMSREAVQLVNPEIMKWASGNSVVTEITGEIEHIKYFTDHPEDTLLLICPASYNVIGKIASGISDDVPSLFFSFAFGNGNPVVICPAMHEGMMKNPVKLQNLQDLQSMGVIVVPPRIESLKAKISDSENILDYVSRSFNGQALNGKKVLIIGGRGEETIDPVRTLTNHGSGFTASWFVRNAFRLGSEEVFFVGNSTFTIPEYARTLDAFTMEEFEEKTIDLIGKNKFDVIINTAALPDFSVVNRSMEKIDSKKSVELKLIPRKKLNDLIREKYDGFLAVFKLSGEFSMSAINEKFRNSSPDLIVFNPYSSGDGAFGLVSNDYTIITGNELEELGKVSKAEMSWKVLSRISELVQKEK